MRKYVRSRIGSMFFFTLVTQNRRPILTTPLGRRCLREAIAYCRTRHPFDVTAIVLLPDHLHAVLDFPLGDNDYSTRLRLIKSRFSTLWIRRGGSEVVVNASRKRRQERGIWQRRFYEHTCRDEEDVRRCIDYIHVNPLKHGLVARVIDWKWSSFHRYLKEGYYGPEWGSAAEWYGDEFQHAE